MITMIDAEVDLAGQLVVPIGLLSNSSNISGCTLDLVSFSLDGGVVLCRCWIFSVRQLPECPTRDERQLTERKTNNGDKPMGGRGPSGFRSVSCLCHSTSKEVGCKHHRYTLFPPKVNVTCLIKQVPMYDVHAHLFPKVISGHQLRFISRESAGGEGANNRFKGNFGIKDSS